MRHVYCSLISSWFDSSCHRSSSDRTLWLYTRNSSATGRNVQRSRVLMPTESVSVSYWP